MNRFFHSYNLLSNGIIQIVFPFLNNTGKEYLNPIYGQPHDMFYNLPIDYII